MTLSKVDNKPDSGMWLANIGRGEGMHLIISSINPYNCDNSNSISYSNKIVVETSIFDPVSCNATAVCPCKSSVDILANFVN